jgi:5'-nucleotidase
MTAVDCFDGAKQRAGKPLDEGDATGNSSDKDLLVVNPTVDGRLKDEAQN